MSEKMWAGRFKKQLDSDVNDFNSSIRVDCRMYKSDIGGSIAHASMLATQGIISKEDAKQIIKGLEEILNDLETGALSFDMTAEDIHMFVEAELTKRIGDTGKKLHTARSRNDQVALDIRLHLLSEAKEITELLKALIEVILEKAETYKATVMPGYTHLQRAQPITFGHHLMAYAQMFLRDISRVEDAAERMNYSPLGACALAGTTYPTDRIAVAKALGMNGICENSLDAVSDRDFAVELANACSLIMMHLSRFSEEIILWSSWEFKFIELDDAYSTGSSIMPQKKNPDIAELVRGKTGRVYGDLITLLTMLKGLPLAYNKDMQEDKEAVFDAVDTVKTCLLIFVPMLNTVTVIKENMLAAAAKGFINATDVADYLTKKGTPFRTAYKISGTLVAYCIDNGKTLEELTLNEFKEFSPDFEKDIFEAINLENCTFKRNSRGGTSVESVERQIQFIKEQLK
ncbi:MAG: argininosuccinate lyase [Ruminococcaceae bacterium]|nr:argininosuccinate lyase [Oscillospiraceae bacterium]